MEFLFEYGLFFAKTLTLVIAIIAVIGFAVAMAAKQKGEEGELRITDLGERYKLYRQSLEQMVLSEAELKNKQKQEKKEEKQRAKEEKAKAKQLEKQAKTEDADTEDSSDETQKRRIFVLDFDGDIRASDVDSLRTEITAVLTIADPKLGDEILVRLESAGGWYMAMV